MAKKHEFLRTVFHIFATYNQQMQISYQQAFVLGISQFMVGDIVANKLTIFEPPHMINALCL